MSISLTTHKVVTFPSRRNIFFGTKSQCLSFVSTARIENDTKLKIMLNTGIDLDSNDEFIDGSGMGRIATGVVKTRGRQIYGD
jgi:hypothetical protein